MMSKSPLTRLARKLASGLALGALAATAAAGSAQADGFPEKPVTIIVAYAAGGGTDIAVRALTETLSEKLGQPVLVQNVTGAGGGVAAGQVSRADPDGYTLLATNSTSITLAPMVQPSMYDMKDFRHVGMIGEFQNAVFSNKDKPYKTLDSLIETAKTEGRAVKAASYMALDRLVMQYVVKEKGADVVLVPVNGANGAVQAVLSGDVDIAFSGGSWAPIVRAGDATALFAASYNHLKTAPDLTSMKDLGFPFGATSHISLSAPAGTPDDVVATLAKALEAAVNSDLAQTVGEKRYMDMTFQDPKQATETMNTEHETYKALVESVGTGG
ncbi:MAG: tripartite tricarboxylate transporter substrate binding protein [Rhodospirillum sp.]|nr:tripartite tricarboxylate transporter substrate binding protein [Rhodospirillum sp.]MCF8488580.1 tripartite tricarboxylate transporter substrate binding protein [Rhodospirillum sp.]